MRFKPMSLLQAAVEGAVAAGGAEAKKILEGWIGLKTDVSKKVSVAGGDNEYKKVGEVIIPIPTLSAFGVEAASRPFDKEKDGEEDDGLPIYTDEKMDWLHRAVVAACKAQARNKLVSGTATLKDGLKIAENFEELTAEGERRGNAEALKLAKEIQTSFASYVEGLGKSQATQAVLVAFFRQKSALALQTEDTKTKMLGYLTGYAETLEPKDLERYGKALQAVEDACKSSTPTDF